MMNDDAINILLSFNFYFCLWKRVYIKRNSRILQKNITKMKKIEASTLSYSENSDFV